MKYTDKDIYVGFTMRNQNGSGNIYQVMNIYKDTIELKGIDTTFHSKDYSLVAFVDLLNDKTYIEQNIKPKEYEIY